MAKYLALDYGSARIGMAISNGYLAKPLPVMVVKHQPWPHVMNMIKDLITKEKISAVVIGWPTQVNSHQQHLSIQNQIRIFYRSLQKHCSTITHLTFHLFDEKLTSKMAQAVVLHRSRTQTCDSVAAAVLLNMFLAANKG